MRSADNALGHIRVWGIQGHWGQLTCGINDTKPEDTHRLDDSRGPYLGKEVEGYVDGCMENDAPGKTGFPMNTLSDAGAD